MARTLYRKIGCLQDYSEFQKELNLCVSNTDKNGKPRTLRYHTKGRNNLAEMYSAFSAENPMSQQQIQDLQKFAYDGLQQPILTLDANGHENYTDQTTNINTELNLPLIEHLLAKKNIVYFCGEARTHCVKATLQDVMKVVLMDGSKYTPQNVVLIADMSSPIEGELDDIADLMREKNFSVIQTNLT